MARILLIDDDDLLREALRLTLVHFGHAVIAARNGREGLAQLAHAEVDLVITDIVMPDQDGLEVVRALQKRRPPVKIIAISGGARGSSVDYLPVARRFGAAKVLAKPFSNEALLSAIEAVLAGEGAMVPTPAAG